MADMISGWTHDAELLEALEAVWNGGYIMPISEKLGRQIRAAILKAKEGR